MTKHIYLLFILLLCILNASQAQVANDDCTSAQPITVPSSGLVCINGTNDNAVSNGGTNACDVAPAGNEVWFTYVATGSLNDITVTPNGAPISDAVITIYTGGCAALFIESCNNSIGGAAVNDIVGLTPGTQVWISVESEGTDGDFELCISSTSPNGNPGNNCATAAPLCRKEPFSYGNLNGYTPSGFRPTCFGAAVQRDIWFKFTVGATGTLEWAAFPLVAQEFDWALYDITNGCPNNNTPPVSCNYYFSQPLAGAEANPIGMGPVPAGADAGEFNPAVTVTAGRTYALLIDNYSGNNGGFDFNWGGSFKMAPTSSFDLSPYQACNSLTTSFTNTSIGADTYAWTFGDGTSSNAQNPPGKTYNTPGNYIVSLTTTTTEGCIHTVTKVAVVSAPIVTLIASTDSICLGDSLDLNGNVTITSFQNPIPFTAIEDAIVTDNNATGYTSTINVTGVFPTIINPGEGELKEVVINIDHKRVSDLDVSLRCPNGTTIDLTSDNGGNGTNYENTRFIPGAPPITGGVAPFTGDYAPEQPFTNLNGCPVSGNWELIVVDDQAGQQPYFDEWSLSFKNENNVSYSWSPAAEITNQLGMNHRVAPTATTTYTLSATDALGCTEDEFVTIFVDEPVDAGLDTTLLVCSNGGNFDLSQLIRNASALNGSFLDPNGDPIGNSIVLNTAPSGEYKYVLTTDVCVSDDASFYITIAPKPTPTITGDSLICLGTSTTLTAAGGDSYVWRPGNETTNNITVSPTIDTEYTLVANSQGCLDSITTTVVVETPPNAGNNGNTEVCNDNNPLDLFGVITGYDINGTWTNNDGVGSLNTTSGLWNPNLVGEGIYTFDYFTPGINVCPNDTSTASVKVWEVPDITIGTIDPICVGDSIKIPVNISGSNPTFTVVIREGGFNLTFTDLNHIDTIVFVPKVGKVYTINSVTSSGSTVCSKTVSINVPVTFLTPPTISVDSLSCNNINTQYQAYLKFQDGDMNSYTLNGSIDVSGNSTYISSFINSGYPFKFWITDANGCSPVDTVQGIYACGCASFAGTMESSTPTDYCLNDTVFATHRGNHIMDGNDTLSFVLHDKPGATIGNVIAHKTNPVFKFDPATMSLETTYYIVAVAGDSLVGGLVDLSNPNGCLNISNSVPVIFHDLPTVAMTGDTTICDGQTADLNFAITGKSPFSIDYTANGVANVFIRTGSGKQQVGPLSDSTLYIATQITDDNGCSSNSADQVMVHVNPIPTVQLSTLKPSYCFGDSAYLVFNATGNGPWSIDYSDGSNTYNLTTNNATDSVLVKDGATTTYSLVQVSDNTNPACVGTNSSTVTFTVNPIPTAVLSGSTAICFGSSATVNIATTGNSDFLITIDDEGAGFVHNTATDGNSFVVAPTDTTTYTITNITDGSSPTCSSTLTSAVTIDVNPTPTLSVVTINDTICEGDSTLFTLHLTSDGPYDVTYFDGTNNTTLTNVDSAYAFYLSPSASTTYTFNDLTDNDVPAPACSINPNIVKNVVVFKRPTVSFGSDLEICEGDTAFLPYSVDGVNPRYSAYYTHNNGPEQVFNNLEASGLISVPNLSPGLHTFQLTRANDSSSPKQCFKPQTASIQVQVNPTPTVTISSDTTLCAGETLAIRFNFPTGIPNYDVTLADGLGNSFPLNNISSGYVFNTVPTDSTNFSVVSFFDRTNAQCAGVWDMDPVTVNINPIPSVTFTGNDTICIGQTTDLTFRGLGVSDFSYHLNINGVSAGALGPVDSLHIEPVTPLVTTTYAITQMDDGSTRTCSSFNQGEVTIVVRPLPTAEISGANEVCFGTDVSLNVDVTGYGPFDITYRDQTGTLFQETYQQFANTYTHSLPVGSHTFDLVSVTMSEDPFCAAEPATLTGLATFRIDPIPDVRFEILDGQTCSPVDATFINKTDSIFLGNCTWSLGDGRTINSCNDTLHNIAYIREGSYDVNLTIVAPLSTRCTNNKLVPDAIIVHPDPVADFGYSPEPATIENNTVKLNNRTVNGQTYFWTIYDTDGSVYTTSNETSPYIEFPNEDEGEYDVHLYALSPYGCTDEITKVVTVEGILLVNIPNSFTPNGDGVNDFFGPVVYGAYTNEDFSFEIFDRWGEVIFSTNVYDPQSAKWDGNFNGKMAQEGTYVYRVIAKSLYSDKIEEYYGEFTLLR